MSISRQYLNIYKLFYLFYYLSINIQNNSLKKPQFNYNYFKYICNAHKIFALFYLIKKTIITWKASWDDIKTFILY